MDTAIVTTTIHIPKLLEGYVDNIRTYGHSDVRIVVIGDIKTPTGTASFCNSLSTSSGIEISYYDVQSQKRFLKQYPDLDEHIPYNSIDRRNIGILEAYNHGADIIITIDDDNFILPDHDFIACHGIVGTTCDYISVHSATGWFNVCTLLNEKNSYPIFHRGYPLDQRWRKGSIELNKAKGKVVVNAGLWIDAPDIDAITWLDLPISVTSYKASEFKNGVGLSRGTWCPFNSQNTAIARDVIPAYFLSPCIGRYDDVWASYIVQAITDHIGGTVHFGYPVVRQKRNPHNYFADLDNERMGMELTPKFTSWLRGVRFTEMSYAGCFRELTHLLACQHTDIFSVHLDEHRRGIDQFVEGLTIWSNVHESMRVRV